MKAIVLKDKVKPGGDIAPLHYEEVAKPKAAEGEVVVRLKNAALIEWPAPHFFYAMRAATIFLLQ